MSRRMKLSLTKNFRATCECPPEGLKLDINSIGGHICTLSLPCESSIATTKAKIEQIAGILAREQRLVLRSCELQDNEVLSACLKGSSSLSLLRRPPEQALWLEQVTRGCALLGGAPQEIKDDAEVAFAAVRCNACNFQNVSEALRDNRELALIAVQGLGGSIFERGLSERLRGDRNILQQALQHSRPGYALRLASEELRHDKQLLLEAIKRQGDLINQAPEVLQADADVIKAARVGFMNQAKAGWELGGCSCCGGIEVPLSFYADRDFVLSATKHGELSFVEDALRLNPELKSDEFVRRALNLYWEGIGSQYSAKFTREDEHARNRLKRLRREQTMSKTKRLDRSKARGGRHKTSMVVEDWHFW